MKHVAQLFIMIVALTVNLLPSADSGAATAAGFTVRMSTHDVDRGSDYFVFPKPDPRPEGCKRPPCPSRPR